VLWRNERSKISVRNCESKRLLEDLGLVTYLVINLLIYLLHGTESLRS